MKEESYLHTSHKVSTAPRASVTCVASRASSPLSGVAVGCCVRTVSALQQTVIFLHWEVFAKKARECFFKVFLVECCCFDEIPAAY